MPVTQKNQELAHKVDAILPQTQCTQCGFDGCYAYSEALVKQETEINRCPPGGVPVLLHLAELLQQEVTPLNTECGDHKPPQVVRIEEEICIGCTKCIQACPVDAIVGTKKMMHTIIAQECTGCELCIPPCPLDCIIIEPFSADSLAYTQYTEKNRLGLTLFEQQRAQKSRQRFNARKARMERREQVTETLPPQETQLADRAKPQDMLALIQQAKKQFKNNHE